MLVFDKASHSYRNPYTQDVYTSATTLINKFKKKFDADFFAKKTAEREGITPEEVKSKWKKINEESKHKGSQTHSVIDVFNKTGQVTAEFETLLTNIQDSNLYDFKKIKCEELVYNHEYKLAGTADVIEDCQTIFHVYDFKTNKKFNTHSPYNSTLLEPLSHLSECEYNTYALQLSLYAYMYQSMTGKRVGKLVIVHIDANHALHSYHAPYMLADVKNMLYYHAQNKLG